MRSALEWAQVRALAADGVSQREVARRLGISRNTVRRLAEADQPPRYLRAPAGPMLDPLVSRPGLRGGSSVRTICPGRRRACRDVSPCQVQRRAPKARRAPRFESGRPIARVARDLGVHRETLRLWVRQAEADQGLRQDRLTRQERERLKDLEKENRELRRANEILKAASSFFAAELDPTRPKR